MTTEEMALIQSATSKINMATDAAIVVSLTPDTGIDVAAVGDPAGVATCLNKLADWIDEIYRKGGRQQ